MATSFCIERSTSEYISHWSPIENFGGVPFFGLVRPLVFLCAKTQLHGGVAVRLRALDLEHGAWPRLHDRHGNRGSFFVEDPGHSDLFSD